MRIEPGMLDAFKWYWFMGFNPGSFGVAVLLGDKTLAKETAHPLLLDEVINNLFLIVDSFPQVCRGSHESIDTWINNGGANSWQFKNSDEQVLLTLQGNDHLIDMSINWLDYLTTN